MHIKYQKLTIEEREMRHKYRMCHNAHKISKVDNRRARDETQIKNVSNELNEKFHDFYENIKHS